MSPTVLAFILQGLQAIPTLIAAGQSVKELIDHQATSLKAMQAEKRDPNAEEWAAQAAIIHDLRALLHAP